MAEQGQTRLNPSYESRTIPEVGSGEVDRVQLATFTDALFRYADEGFVAVRAFPDGGGTKPFRQDLWASVDIAHGLDAVVNAVARIANAAAAPGARAVVCPPIATFMEAGKAREADLRQGLALSIELDVNPAKALAKARALLGAPTVVLRSGGEWTDPTTGELHSKLHAHWRLAEPAMDEDLAVLKDVRRRLTGLVGGDPSNVPAVHPIRWAGTPHRKNGERWAHIVELNSDAEIELRDIPDKLPAAAANDHGEPTEPFGERQAMADLVTQITSGEHYHEPLVCLAMRHVKAGMVGGQVVETLRGLMNAVPPEKRDGDEPGRWEARYDSIPKIVRSAEQKLGVSEGAPAVPASWQGQLKRTEKGDPRDCLANVATILRTDDAFTGKLGFDELRGSVVTRSMPWKSSEGWREWTDLDDLRLAEWCQLHDVQVKPATVAAAVQVVASEQSFHPVRNYLDGLQRDTTNRLDKWPITYLGVKDTPYARAVGRAWMISAIARVRQPGCKADHAIILEGPQGVGKSRTARTLAAFAEWFADEVADLGSKDSAQDLRGKWIIELGELSAMRRSDVERVKAFMSRSTDHYRPSYGRRAQDFPRQCVFIGSTNADSYLADETGGRRFWPLKVGQIKLDELRRDLPKLWAEADQAYKNGEKWWLDAETEALAQEQQGERHVEDVWEPAVEIWLSRQKAGEPVRIDQILAAAIGMPTERQTQDAKKRVGAILRSRGWWRKRDRLPKTEGGGLVWFFHPPVVPPAGEDDSMGNMTGNSQTSDDAEGTGSVPDVPHVPPHSEAHTREHHTYRTMSPIGGGLRSQTITEVRGTTGNREHSPVPGDLHDDEAEVVLRGELDEIEWESHP